MGFYPRGAEGAHAGAGALGLVGDATQPGQRASGAGRARERYGAVRRGGGGLPRSTDGVQEWGRAPNLQRLVQGNLERVETILATRKAAKGARFFSVAQRVSAATAVRRRYGRYLPSRRTTILPSLAGGANGTTGQEVQRAVEEEAARPRIQTRRQPVRYRAENVFSAGSIGGSASRWRRFCWSCWRLSLVAKVVLLPPYKNPVVISALP